jgi:hypothetical protein
MPPSYKTNDPKGWCGDPSRGAALGRITRHDAPTDQPITLYLQHIRLDDGGYDTNGTYFGTGDPLYWYADDDGDVDAVLRANGVADAQAKVLEVYPLARFKPREDSNELDEFTTAYITCALWSSTDNDSNPLDKNRTIDDLPEATIKQMAADCSKFQTEHAALLKTAYEVEGYNEGHAGHDFWLTRNGHGAGFWDRNLGHVGDRLTEAAKKAGEVNLYVGDDGLVYVD